MLYNHCCITVQERAETLGLRYGDRSGKPLCLRKEK
jgi:hypothetical protein